MVHKLRTLEGSLLTSRADHEFLRRKISAAGEMKSAIKGLLDAIDAGEVSIVGVRGRKAAKRLRKSMEEYLNVS